MITSEDKEEFMDEIRSLVESDFTSLDVCRFIRDNNLAQRLLENCDFCDYEKEIDFINNHSDSEIEHILNTQHLDFYDPDFGSTDPLMGLRINKYDYEKDGECLTFENLDDYDNVLSHIKYVLDNYDC